MRVNRMKKTVVAMIMMAALVTTTTVQPATAASKVTLTISAAASLTDAMNDIAKLYQKDNSNITVKFNFGASGALATQIQQGANVDVFLSAATKQMDTLKKGGFIMKTTVSKFAYNDIVAVVPKKSKISIKSFKDLSKSAVTRVALGEPSTVPAGQYAKEVFTYYGNLKTVTGKAVYGSDVRQVLSWVESGNVSAGVVYKTDALSSSNVKIACTAPAKSHTAVVYPGAVIKSTNNEEEAAGFVKYLTGKKAVKVFKKYGFKTN